MRPDPKDYPFNYVVHEGDDKFEFENYNDAIEFVKANWPERDLDQEWSHNDSSSLYMVMEGNFKAAWNKSELVHFESLNIDEDQWPDGRDLIIERHSIAEKQVLIERCRDAYEAACIEATEDQSESIGNKAYECDVAGCWPDQAGVCVHCGFPCDEED